MCRWRWWLIAGFFLVPLLTAVALNQRTNPIQTDLGTRGAAVLAAGGQDWARLSFDGRDGVLTGEAPSPEDRAKAAAAVLDEWGVRVLADNTTDLPVANPFALTLERAGTAVTVSGVVPSKTVKAEVVAAAGKAFPGAVVTDRTRLARGAPAGLAAAAAYAATQLGGLSAGKVAITGTDIAAEGRATSLESYGAVMKALDGSTPGFTVVKKDIVPPVVSPYVWNATRGAGNTVELGGYVPNDTARKAITEAAAAAVPGATIRDSMRLADGSPAGYLDAARFGVARLADLETGKAALSDLALTVEGQARTPDTYAAARKALAGTIPGNAKATEAILPAAVSPYVWSAKLAAGAVTLGGFVPSESARQAVVAATRQALPGATVTDEMKIAAGAPAEFAAATAHGIAQLPRFTTGSVSLSGKAWSVDGTAKTPTDFSAAKAAAAAAALPAGVQLGSETIRPAAVTNWTWGATKAGTAVTLTGLVPSEAARGAVVTAAKLAMPDATVTDEMQIASGPPGTLTDTAGFALAQLSGMTEGTASIAPAGMTIKGKTADFETWEKVNRALGRPLPGGAKLASADVDAGPVRSYVFGGSSGGGAIELTGLVPDEATRKKIVQEAELRFGKLPIRDLMRVAPGAPSGYFDAISAAFGGASRLQDGSVRLAGRDVTVDGKAFYERAIEDVRETIRAAMPSGWTTQATGITVLDPLNFSAAECQAYLRQQLSVNFIRFETARANISPVSASVLDRLVYGVRSCPNSAIEIEGHTDSDGSDENNQRLSDARAAAVVEYLTRAGIPAPQLKSIGFGESRPIASNDTAEGKSQNRRIEFKVVGAN